jgi:hypothetical protein
MSHNTSSRINNFSNCGQVKFEVETAETATRAFEAFRSKR